LRSQLLKFAAAVTGPGLLFVGFAWAIFLCALIFGGVASEVRTGEMVISEDIRAAIHARARDGAQSDTRQPSVTAPTVTAPMPNAPAASREAATSGALSSTTGNLPVVDDVRRPRWEDSAARRAAKEISATTSAIDEQNMRKVPSAAR
jgi:hypothetical protein